MPNKSTNVGNVLIKAENLRTQDSLEICHLLIFYTTMHTYSNIILIMYLT